jgi:DNA-binding XRE family transcriptional regulator
MGALKMEEKKFSEDAHQWMYERYIKDDPQAREFLQEVKVQADLAGQIYTVRHKLGMTREQLAEFSGLTAEVIEDLEESDYDGDWDAAIAAINKAFHRWFTTVILPASKMTPDDYSVKLVNA